ncbi:GTP-binding protein HflX, partial [gut metagenome]
SKARWESGVYRVALAGYTNAGKSTLMNALTDSDVYVKDELFATLDPTTRSLTLEEGRKITLSDTVGFIQKLPTTLVEAFHSTLAEVRAADLVLVVADAADEAWQAQVNAVIDTLAEIDATDIPRVLVLNKIDAVGPDELEALRLSHPEAEFISALEKARARQPAPSHRQGGLGRRPDAHGARALWQGAPHEHGPRALPGDP